MESTTGWVQKPIFFFIFIFFFVALQAEPQQLGAPFPSIAVLKIVVSKEVSFSSVQPLVDFTLISSPRDDFSVVSWQ